MSKLIISRVVLYVFALSLLIPALDHKRHFLPDAIATEKRELASRPNYSLHTPLKETIKAFEAYWNDNFGGRAWFISLYASLWTRVFHESPVPYVVIGRDGWLFYKSEQKDDGPGINDLQGLTPLTQDQLGSIVSNISAVNDAVQKQKMTLIIVVAPNKQTIYSDKLPTSIVSTGQSTRLDQLKAVMPTGINFIDLRSILKEGRSMYPTYFKTDSHWNNFGAFLAAQTVLGNVPGSTPLKMSDYTITISDLPGEGDVSSMMAARGVFQEISLDVEPIVKPTVTLSDFTYVHSPYIGQVWQQSKVYLPNILIYGDSFRGSMARYLAPHFQKTYVMPYSIYYDASEHMITSLKPTIVIWEVAERYIDRLNQRIY